MAKLTSRRDLLLGAGALAVTSTLPALIHAALAQDQGTLAGILKGLKPAALSIPPVTFKLGQNACAGPWGEVRIVRFGSTALPLRVRSANQLGLIEMATPRPFVQLGVGRTDVITWTSHGVTLGRGAKLEQWSAATARKLRDAIKADRHKVRALMQLRSTLISSYPAFVDASHTTTVPQAAMELERVSEDMATSKTFCSQQEAEEAVQRTEREIVEIWSSAGEQYEKCFRRETSGAKELACSYLPSGDARNLCATGVCSAKTFVDVLVDTIESVRIVTDIVVREIIVCQALSVKNAMIATWSAVDRGLPGLGLPGTKVLQATLKDKEAALQYLQQAAAALGPLARELLKARWELLQREALHTADGRDALVFDVKVHLKTLVVEGVTASAVASEFAATQGILFSMLAAAHPGFAAAVLPWGITVSAALVASIPALSAAATSVVAIVVAMIVLVLLHGTQIIAQLEAAKQAGKLADHEARIELMRLTVEQVYQELEYQRTQAAAQTGEPLFQPPVVIG